MTFLLTVLFAVQHFPSKPLPTEHDAMAKHHTLINRAIAMHLLREGQFNVASTFIEEAADLSQPLPPEDDVEDADDDADMETDEDEEGEVHHHSHAHEPPHTELASIQSAELQSQFAHMYSILQALRAHDLGPAIDWARSNSEELEARGSNLEFELSKLQFVWLFKGAGQHAGVASHEPPFSRARVDEALLYAREHFARFQPRHLHEVQQLACALVFASNIRDSPYAALFGEDAASPAAAVVDEEDISPPVTTTATSLSGPLDEVAASFTREFCSLLGLSAESPLYVAATAGVIALPRLIKYISATRSQRTEWTTADELAFETPLPSSMIYHSIFVCPVSKEQTTDTNPPMMLPCGHVLARESLQHLTKGTKFKCPYCPSEGHTKDARQIVL